MAKPMEHMSSVIPGSRSRSSTPARREKIAGPSSAPNALNAAFIKEVEDVYEHPATVYHANHQYTG